MGEFKESTDNSLTWKWLGGALFTLLLTLTIAWARDVSSTVTQTTNTVAMHTADLRAIEKELERLKRIEDKLDRVLIENAQRASSRK